MKGMNFRRLNPFQLNLAFHIENLSSDLHCKSNDCFYMKRKPELKWVNRC